VCREGKCTEAICSKDTDCPNDAICQKSACMPISSIPRPALIPAPANVPPPPPNYVPQMQEESLKPLWITGIVIESVTYVTTIVLTAALSQDSVRGQAIAYTVIPVFGPFVLLGSSIANPNYAAPLAISGVVQIASVAMIVTGLCIHHAVPLSYSFGDGPNAAHVSIEPLAAVGRAGVQLHAVF
jgi:hypothetical protein